MFIYLSSQIFLFAEILVILLGARACVCVTDCRVIIRKSVFVLRVLLQKPITFIY